MASHDKRGNKITDRRAFLERLAKGAALGISASLASRPALAADAPAVIATGKAGQPSVDDYLTQVVLNRSDVDRFLDPDQPNWARFDPELGYVLRNCVRKDGLDGAYTLGTYHKPHGQRQMIHFADRPCRINTYGDSFTMCHQVSDGETWQEQLAAHIGEPIRNFGVGGYGVYQAYRRMLRTEITDVSTPCVILNIWGLDDHYRSIDAWRYLRCHGWLSLADMFHVNPWDYLGIDLDTGRIIEKKNLCPTPESLYKLCDPDFVRETFREDPVLNLYLAGRGGWTVHSDVLEKLAESMHWKLDLSSPGQSRYTARTLHWEIARRATLWVLDKARRFCNRNQKELLILLSYSGSRVIDACKGAPRRDQDFLDALAQIGLRYVDTLEKHKQDYRAFRLTPDAYVKRYFIGHYNPTGNHFFAFAIKNDIVDWLDPEPPAYQTGSRPTAFEKYL